MHRHLKCLCAALLLLSSINANAHYPLMSCIIESNSVTCEAGFSDGSLAVNKKVTVLDYDDNVLLSLKTSQASQVVFERPQGEFYIRFDAGHEAPVEIDYDEL
ncbi:hypothetical protein H4O21_06925 [Oceanospirillum sp. D5]|uniref:Uncharacterized protein n=1 Tax=Oceanospirillum sediminis TaxID=2760088 RepID=A0A839IPF6_9GAMM|nr:hypothetical protein [Oceanospirillum sediminis]